MRVYGYLRDYRWYAEELGYPYMGTVSEIQRALDEGATLVLLPVLPPKRLRGALAELFPRHVAAGFPELGLVLRPGSPLAKLALLVLESARCSDGDGRPMKPFPQREAEELRRAGLSYREIARRLGEPKTTVWRRLRG